MVGAGRHRDRSHQAVGDHRTRIVLTRTFCSPSRLRKQDSQLSAFPLLTSFSLSSCSLTFLWTCFPPEICSESWQNSVLLPPSCLVSSWCLAIADPDSGYGRGQRVAATTEHLRKNHFWNQVAIVLHAQRKLGMRGIFKSRLTHSSFSAKETASESSEEILSFRKQRRNKLRSEPDLVSGTPSLTRSFSRNPL